MRVIGIALILSFWNCLDAAPANVIPESNELFKEINLEQPNDIDQKFNPDVVLTTPEMIRKAGYSAEAHIVTTEDGYLLALHRIPGGNNSLPVLLQHGYLASSANWVYLGKGKALAYLLADQGYDVWLGNFRGNIYSRAHTTLSPSNSEFWDFSFHEVGIYDLPAMISYITNVRSQPLHAYVGHSMGTCIFYVMASQRPESGRMVEMMVSLAPTAFLDHMKSALRYIVPLYGELKVMMDDFFHGEFLNRDWFKFLAILCNQNPTMQEFCVSVLYIITGYDFEQLDYTQLLPVTMAHDLVGASIKSLTHFAQESESGKFRQYDYGREKNLLLYNSSEPPDYDVTKITVPTALFYSKNDLLINPDNVKKLSHLLPNVIDMYEIPLPNFNHVDYIFAKDAPKLVYERIIKLFRRENPNVISVK